MAYLTPLSSAPIHICIYELSDPTKLKTTNNPVYYQYIRPDFVDFRLNDRQVAYIKPGDQQRLINPTPGTQEYFLATLDMLHGNNFLTDAISQESMQGRIRDNLLNSATLGFKPALQLVIYCLRSGAYGFEKNESKAQGYQILLSAILNQTRDLTFYANLQSAPSTVYIQQPPKEIAPPAPVQAPIFHLPRKEKASPPKTQLKFSEHPLTKTAEEKEQDILKAKYEELEKKYKKLETEFNNYKKNITMLEKAIRAEERLRGKQDEEEQTTSDLLPQPSQAPKRMIDLTSSAPKRQKKASINSLLDNSSSQAE